MKRKFLAMTMAITVSLSGIGSWQPQVQAAEITTGDEQAETEDLSPYVLQEGGSLIQTTPPRNGIMPLAGIDDSVKQQVQKALTDAWDACTESCDLSGYAIPTDDMEQIYFETLNKNPKYFYVAGKYSSSYNPTTNEVININISYNITDTEEIKTKRAEYEAAVSKITANAQESWSDAEKALYINDYLARNCSYDTSLANHSAYDALVTKSAVCQGYALAFLELAQRLGLPCEIVSSKQLNHAWNLVKVGEFYYHTDVTWNDPVTDQIGRAMHHYFLKSTNYFKTYPSSGGSGHNANDWVITGGITEDAANDLSYDEAVWQDIDTGLDFINGAWYGFNGNDGICKYTWTNDNGFQAAEKLVEITDQWSSESGGYWNGKFAGTGISNGAFYYSDSTTIYQLDLDTKEKTPIYTLTDEQKANANAIYGMHITPEGIIQYILSNDPNDPGQVCVLSDYRIEFDANGAESGTMDTMDGLMFHKEYTLPKNQLKKNGYCFAGWNTAADGNGTAYQNEGTVLFESSAASNGQVILYAQWKEHGEVQLQDQADATCTKDGYTGDTYCKDCGELIAKGEKIPMLAHTEVIDEAIAATCTTDGKTQGSHCSVCNTVINAQETIPAAHNWNTDYTVDQEATSENPGKKSIHCSNCDATKDEQEIPKLTPDTPGQNKPGDSSSGNNNSGNNNSGSSSGNNSSGNSSSGNNSSGSSSSGSNYYPGTWQPGSSGNSSTTAPGNNTGSTTPGNNTGSTTTPGNNTTTPGSSTATPGSTPAPGDPAPVNPPTTSENTMPAPFEYQTVTDATANADGAFVNSSGEIMKNAMVQTADGTKYITDETGKKVTGSLLTAADGMMYCTQKDGAVAENQTVSVSGKKYFAKEDGTVARNEFCTTSYGNMIYATNDGTLASNCIFQSGSSKYFAKKSGVIAKGEFCTTKAGNTVYAKADHTLAMNTIINQNGKKYFAKKNGVIAKKAFSTTAKGSKIYSRANGTVVTNKLFQVNGKRYYAKKNGALAVKTWVTVGNKKYYCNASGVITKVRLVRS